MSCKENCSISTLATRNTKYHADVVEWCPSDSFQDYFVCGTYELQESSQQWLGGIELYRLSLGDNSSTGSYVECINSVDFSGVFDVKWCPNSSPLPSFAVASADGLIHLFCILSDGSDTQILDKVYVADIAKEEKIKPLSLDWNMNEHSSKCVVTSDSAGCLNYLQLSAEASVHERRWQAHSFEAWIAAFDDKESSILYSGGDDCFLKGWDLRTSLEAPCFQNSSHTMGVTSIAKNKDIGNLLATGSYDEHIFLWDTRKMKEPVTRFRIEGGGAWKCKWHPYYSHYLITAAMHAGFHVIQIDEGWHMNVNASYKEHLSLAYGIDWCYKRHTHNGFNNIVASCSFYDNLLHVWQIDLKKKLK